jgi:hypothetical protein
MSAEASVAEQVNDLLRSTPEVATLTDSALRDELIACEQAAQMLLARQADVMAEMGRRALTADRLEEQQIGRPLASHESRAEFVADEVGVTLTQTRVAAAHCYHLAVEASRSPTVMAAWRSGGPGVRRDPHRSPASAVAGSPSRCRRSCSRGSAQGPGDGGTPSHGVSSR